MHATFLSQPEAGMAYHRLYQWGHKAGKNNGRKDDGTDSEDLGTSGHFIAVSGRVTDQRSSLLRYPMMQTSCLVFRRQAMQDLLPIPEVLRTQADAYLTALIVFICPVVGVDEYLAKYRVHGANLFHGDSAGLNSKQLEERIATREALVAAVGEWMRKHGIDRESADIRDYFTQWRKAQESDGFALRAPGRAEYFSHLIEFPLVYRELMTGPQIIYSYLRAFAALLLGFRHLHYFDNVYARWKKLRT
jgi:hypothetical protein